MVVRIVRHFSFSGYESDDLYQEGMIGLLMAMRSFDESRNDNFEAYAALCVKRKLIDAVKKRRPGEVTEFFEPRDVFSVDPETDLLASEEAKDIRRELCQSLSPLENQVFDLYLDGYTITEISEKTGRGPKSVHNALKRCRTKLSGCLDRRKRD